MIHAADAPETLPVTLKVLSSNGFKGAIQAIAPEYEKVSGVKLDVTVAQASGPTPEAIASRLDRKEDADVVLTMGSSLDTLTARNQVEKVRGLIWDNHSSQWQCVRGRRNPISAV